MASLQFKTTENRKKQNKRRAFAILAILLVIVATASLITYFKERPEKTDEEDTTDTASVTLEQKEDLKEEVNILVAGASSTEDTVEFMVVVHMDTEKKTLSVAGAKAPGSALASKPAELVAAVEKANGISVDKFVVMNQKKFKAFVNNFGSYEINLKENVNYSSDEFSINLLKGKQTLTGEKFYNYLRFTYMSRTDTALQNVAEIVADYISQNFNEKTTEKGQSLFESLANSCETDVTIMDFSKYETFLSEVAKSEEKIDVIKIDDLETKR